MLHARFARNNLFKIRHYLCLYVQSVSQKSWVSELCASVALLKS